MDNEIFAELQQYGFQPVNNNICVGTWQNYAVTLQKINGKNYYVYVAIRIPKTSKELKKSLKDTFKASGEKRIVVTRVMPNFVHLNFNFAKVENPAAAFARWMDLALGVLSQNGIGPADTCAVTRASNPDSLCFMSDPNYCGYQPVCAAAVRANNYEVQDKAEDNENNGSYLSGFIGAVVGMLVGVAVNLLTIVFMERIYALLFALVPIFSMFGYKLFKGKTNKASLVIVVALSLLAIPLMEFLSLSLGLAKEFEAPLEETVKYVSEVFFDSDVLKETGPEMVKLLIFMGLGLLIGWRYLYGQLNSTKVSDSKLRLGSMRPNPNCQLAQQPAQAQQQE